MAEVEVEVMGAADEAAWEHLVSEGREMRAAKLEAEELSRREKRARIDELRGYSTKGHHGKAKVKGGKAGNSLAVVPVGVKRWVVGRFSGMSARECTAAVGVSWGEVVMAYNGSEEVRCAVDALHRASRKRMEMLAHSTMEEVLEGRREVSAVAARGAEWALERIDSEHFSDPRVRGVNMGESGGNAIGGIVINLIDPKSAVRVPAVSVPAVGVEA